MDLTDTSGKRQIWVLPLDRGVPIRLTFDASMHHDLVWSPDGSKIVFAAQQEGGSGLYLKDATDAGNETQLLKSEVPVYPDHWSPDGRSIIYTRLDPKTKRDLWTLSVADKTSTLLVGTPASIEDMAEFSPDGRWIEYVSDESGRMEVYVRPAVNAGRKWLISKEGGRQPHWRGGGKELFYVAGNGSVTAASITSGANIEVGLRQNCSMPNCRIFPEAVGL